MIKPEVLHSFYYQTFSSESGLKVLNDLKILLTGCGVTEYEPVNHKLPANELAAQVALRNVWDVIDALTNDIPKKPISKMDMLREAYRIYKTK